MTKRDYENRHRFIMNLNEEYNHNATQGMTWRDIDSYADELHRLNSRLHTLSERSCNGQGWSGRRDHWDDKDEARFEKSWDNAMLKVKAIFSKFGVFDVTEQGDPRGWGMFEVKSRKTGQVFRVDW